MSTFRLERLLGFREDQEAEAKVAWAQAEAAVRDAVRAQEVKEAAVALAFDDLSSHRGHQSVIATLRAYERLDALQAESKVTAQVVDDARRRAKDARLPYEERRREVEALRRLQNRWLKEQRKDRRRKENREREAFIQRGTPTLSHGLSALTAGQRPKESPKETSQ